MHVAITHRLLDGLPRTWELLWSLTWRDLRVRYKHSVLGVAWVVLLPLSMMLVFTFVFTRAIDARSLLGIDVPYALYAYVGLVPWTFFAGSISGCVNCLVANRSLVTKIYFPREVFPLSCIATCFVDFCIAMLVLFGLMAYFQWTGQWQFTIHAALGFVPLIAAVQILFTVGMGLLAAMAHLFFRDVRQVITVGLQLWMFISAVVVPVPRDGSLSARIIALNPLVPIITGYRDCILYGRLPEGGPFLATTATSIAVLTLGLVWFRRQSFRFAEWI
jgi:ABC-type polysaccharide/polyol phosphate export permease